MTIMQTNCLNPQIILNPLAKEYISQYGNFTIRGKETILTRCRHLLYDFKVRGINPKRLSIRHDELDTCYITNFESGEIYPLYIEVGCGHCIICKEAKVNAFVQRCKLETQCYNSNPIFLTLTYATENLPENGVSVRDCQLFFKRLRINLHRCGYRERLRYCLVSEYGSKLLTARPHYHAILWNLRQTDTTSFKQIKDFIEKSWNKGFVMLRLVDPSNDRCFYYTSKYLRKDCEVPQGCNKTFILSSNRNGGIGSPFIAKIADNIRKRLDVRPQYVNKWNGKVEDIRLNRYLINKIVPSFSSSLPAYLKRDVRQLLLSYSILKNRNIKTYCDEKVEQIRNFFGQYFYCPLLESSEVKTSMDDSTPRLYRAFTEAEMRISRALAKGREYYDRALAVGLKRQLFLDKLLLHAYDADLSNRAYIINRQNEFAKQRIIL